MSTTRPVVDQSIWDYAARPAASYMSSPISPSYHHLHPHTLTFTTPLTAAQSSFITMSPLTLNASPALAFPEKFRALGKLPNMSIEACILQTPPLTGGDPLASPNPSFDWADDVEQEFYSGDDSDSDSDDGAGSPKVDRPFPSGLRSVRESGFSLAAILEEDEDEEEENTVAEEKATDSSDTRGRPDTNRMFSSGRPTRGHRRYRVASVPSLWAIKEDDEDSDDEDFSDANTTVSTLDSQAEHLNLDTEDDDDDDIDSLRSSRTCVANEGEEERGLAADDLDSGWVRIDAKELDKEARWAPVSSTRARPRPSHSRLRVSSWLKALCSRRGRRASLRR